MQQRLEAHARHVQIEHERLEVLRVRALSARELDRAALRPLPLRVRLLRLDVAHETSGGDEREELQEEHRVVLVDRAARRPDALRVPDAHRTLLSCRRCIQMPRPRWRATRAQCPKAWDSRRASRCRESTPYSRDGTRAPRCPLGPPASTRGSTLRAAPTGAARSTCSTGSTAARRDCWVATVRV